MAYSNKKKVEVEGRNFYRVEIMEYENSKEVAIDHDFVFGYFYKNALDKSIYKAFQISKTGSCADSNCFVKREKQGTYLIRWRGMDDNKYQVITTVKDI